MNAETIAQALGRAKKNGAGWLCRCPADEHKKTLRPLSIRDGDLADIVVKCFAGCSSIDVLRALRHRGLLDDRPHEHRPREHRPPPLRIIDSAKPRRLFDKALPIKNSLVDCYLTEVRGSLILPPHEAVRFMPAQPPHFPWPSMVSLVTDFADANRVLTLHFTDLLPDGSGKAPITPNKRTLKGYPTTGGVIRLTDDAEVTLRLGFAEGIEKSLSIMTSFLRDHGRVEHVWAALNAPNMAELPVVAGIETLVIYGDANEAGRRAKDKLAERWLEAGREVLSGEPPGSDWDEFQ